MTLIQCPDCGSEISPRAVTCPKCGAPIATESALIISAPVQAMMINPKVVLWSGDREIARLSKGQMATIPIDADCVIVAVAGIRMTDIPVRAGRVTRIQLAWDRFTGKLIAQEVERIGGNSPI